MLTDPARFILGKWFGPCRSMVYEMIDCVPSPEMQSALDELVQAGHLIRDNPYAAAVRYTRVDDDMWKTCRSDYSLGWIKVPDFPDHVPRT